MIFHSYFLIYFHFREQREISISTIHAFSSYSSFLNFLPEEEMNPIVLVMYVIEKLIRQIRNSTLELDLPYELHTWEKNMRKY